jgi:PAS domain S-box-containing protein
MCPGISVPRRHGRLEDNPPIFVGIQPVTLLKRKVTMIPSRILLWKCFSFSFVLSLFVSLPSISVASAEARIEGRKNVLILNSYHEGFKWTDDITRGVISALEPVSGETRIFIEYLNTKWVKDDLYFQQLRQILKHKYARIPFDLIISSDNDAFDFLREYRDEVFGRIPVVFNGVNYFKESDLDGKALFTGVSETADLRESLVLALRLHPSVKRIFVINDHSISGRKVKDELEKLAPNFHGRVRIEYENSTDLGKILKDVEVLSPDSMIFYTFFYGDPARTSYENSDCISLISRHARVPVYGAWDFNLGYGIIGGKLTSGYDQGITSGRMGLRILKGERVKDIPAILTSRTRYMFDHRQMARFGIKKSVLPKESIVINGPKTFHEIPNAVIWATLCCIASLGVVIFMLLHVNRQRKLSEVALQKARDGLEKRVEERTRELAMTTEALIAAEQEKALFLNVTDALVLYYDTEMNIHWANRAACESVKMTREELQQKRCWEIWHRSQEPCAGCPVILSKATGEPQEAEMCSPDGRVWFIRGYPVKDKTGRLTGMVELCQDFTERKQAEDLLRKSEIAQRKLACQLAQKNSFLRTLINAIPDLIFFKDYNRAYLGCNRAFEAFAGRPEQDIVGRTDLDIFSRDAALSFHEMDLEILSTEESRRNEEWIDYPDGRRVLLETLKTPFFNLDGEIVGVVGVSRDITERKRMEEELLLSHFCINEAAIGIIQISLDDGKILRVNYSACRSLGYSSEELRTMSIFDIEPSFTREQFADLKRTVDQSGSMTFETVGRRKDGTLFPVEIIANNLEFQGVLTGFSFFRDITQRKQAEEALRESESRVRGKLESILDPGGDTGQLDLADIMDAPEIQALMEDLYRITGLKMSIIDLKGQVLADVGWQDICFTFHRTHPETLKRCHESDSDLTVGVPQGEFRTYRCKNNMWHIVTPIIVGGRHMGNLFMGQFFFADEQIEYDLFRAQARTYGFPEEEYIAALEAVPRHSEELVNLGKAIFLRLTDIFSKLSYANIKLAHSLAERDHLTATLRQANLVVENSPVVLFRWKSDDYWPVELVSGNIIQFGYTSDEFLSGSITYSSILHPDDLERVTREVHDFCDWGFDQFRLEYRIITKVGDVRWVNEHTNVERDASGCVKNFEGIVIDVTERMLMEEELLHSKEKYRSIVDAYDGFIYICSQEYRIEFMNRKLIERTGYDATGRFCYEVLHDRDSACPWCVNKRVFDGETVHWEILSPKDGRWYHVVNVPIYNANGTISKHSVISDINILKLTEERLREQKQLLEELNTTLEKRVREEVANNREKDIMLIQQNRQAALGEMLDHIAHQWKQPLTSLSLVIQDLEETVSGGELTDEHVKETVCITMALLDHMIQTMDIFRGFYRPDKEKKVFNIKDSIDQALAFIAPALSFHSIAVELDVDPGLTAFGYPKEYAQVLLNILANARDALKARETEKPRVIIRAFAEDTKTVVTIADNAGGIPEAIIDKIFDFYFTTNESSGGTGIGLYMSRNIIEKNMGGTLAAVNTDSGALFRIEISPT